MQRGKSMQEAVPSGKGAMLAVLGLKDRGNFRTNKFNFNKWKMWNSQW